MHHYGIVPLKYLGLACLELIDKGFTHVRVHELYLRRFKCLDDIWIVRIVFFFCGMKHKFVKRRSPRFGTFFVA
jgi:hypothetical protein